MTDNVQDTLRCAYIYRFHTSILYTNRQVSNEACQAFYMNNLLVDISLSRNQIANLTIGTFGLNVLSRTNVQLSKRYAMKIYLSSEGEVSHDHENDNYAVTYNEFPGLCRSLLWM